VTIPLTPDAAARFRGGELSDFDIKPSDIRSPSGFVHINSVAEMPGMMQQYGEKAFTRAQSHCMLYQMAYFTRRPSQIDWPPTFMAIAAVPDHVEKMRAAYYVETGSCLPGTDYKIMALERPQRIRSRGYLRKVFSFKLMRALLGLYRVANADQWREPRRS
jgi:hypothetical protein